LQASAWLRRNAETPGLRQDGIYFDHRGDCRDSAHHKTCTGRWSGVVSLGYAATGSGSARRSAARPAPPYESHNLRRDFRKVTAAAGLGARWVPKELRTSFVSMMSYQGVPVEEIARLAGHASSRTTEVVYRRELRPVITAGAEVMDQIFQPKQRRETPAEATG
jgi:integrase-like protein